LKATESIYERIVEASPYPVYYCTGAELIITVANEAALKAWGKDNSVIGMRIIHALPEAEHQSYISSLEKVYQSGDVQIQEGIDCQIIRNDLGAINGILCFGSEDQGKFDSQSSSLARGAEDNQTINEELNALNEELVASNEELAATNDELIQVQSLMHNQALEKQIAVDKLRAHENNIKNMVKQAPVGMCILQGESLYVVEVNDSFLELIGKSRESLFEKPYWEVNSEAAAFYEPITTKVMATGRTYNADEHEVLLIRSGKEEVVYVDFVYEPMLDEYDKPYAIMIVAIDVTDKVSARKQLQRTEESLRLAMEAAGLGSFSINPDTKEFKASPSMKSFFGLNNDEKITFATAINQIREDYRPEVLRQMELSFSGQAKFDMEYPIIGYNDGQIRWVRTMGKMQITDGTKAFTGVLNDITERRKDEERKNDFIGMVSHELKTPLTSMRGYVQMLLLKMRKVDDEFAISSLEKTNTQIGKMTKMINGFLNVSRLESGKIHIDHKIFDLAQLVKETEEESLSTIASYTIIFAPVEETIVNADRDKIGQVINNLISNAVKYSVAGTTIYVACVTIENRALVSVRDEGMGIKPQDASKIFERYYRVEGTQMFSISGFGIGLYLCAEIIHRHEGEIWVDSDFGKGSTFSFSLPVVSPKS
jgi:two-component system sensor histidine kinase VicK